MMKNNNPLKNWRINIEDIRFIGKDLQRPVSHVSKSNGDLIVANTSSILTISLDRGEQEYFFDHEKNKTKIKAAGGLSLTKKDDLVFADWENNCIHLLTSKGVIIKTYTEIDGKPIGKVNSTTVDSYGRIWFTVTTRSEPWQNQINTRVSDGFIGVIDGNKARIVADGFCWANGIRFDAKEEWLYILETTGQRVSRLPVLANGKLGEKELFGPSSLNGLAEGFAFDSYGNLWITMVFTDEIVAITPEGEKILLISTTTQNQKNQLLQAFEEHRMTPDIMGIHGSLVPYFSGITFGGKDMKTVYLGSMGGTSIAYFNSPVSGLKLAKKKSIK